MSLLACVCHALEVTAEEVEGQPGCPYRSCVVAGAVAWDGCSDPCSNDAAGGQLTVSVARMYPSSTFPTKDQTVRGLRGCPQVSTTAAELVVTPLRCAPTVDERGCPPSCEEFEAAARVPRVDAVTVYNAVLCCLPTTAGRRGRQFVMGQQRFLGPEGGSASTSG
ncbi:hypothetical protein [Planotetraspora kaengkrachanensis]|uniref:Uncharacterized protein n=1 Tax=Planotetraspora kaengkrachanensis TaxID=575193 RepID=A0A8J3Q090_9ACTN|nr:hypothetical protein [Planotetraspora kaengkrachanensis]GIG84215.1 hypothetical protein Pka01_73420 [Planotetraspora kaengkrachanensis]